MKRTRVILALLAGFAAVGVGGLVFQPKGTEAAQAVVGPGRYRDGRGRLGREGPPSTTSAPASPLLTGLIAYYKFDGDLQDASGNGHHGTLSGTLTYPAGIINQSAAGGGANRMSLSPALTVQTGNSNFSVSVWSRVTGTLPNTNGCILCDLTGTGLYAQEGGKFLFYTGAFILSDASSWVLNTRVHVVITYNSALFTYYVNGAAFGGGGASLSDWTPSASFNFGGAASYVGELDEFGIWSVTLTADDAAALYNSGAGLAYPF